MHRGDHYWKGMFTVFVDNLPEGITKRALFKEFGKDRYITDIFISKKVRQKSKGRFVFIRFNTYGGAMKSINRMNGTRWGEFDLHVELSRFDRYHKKLENPDTMNQNHRKKRIVREWVEVNKKRPNDDVVVVAHQENTHRKTIEGVWAEDQRDRLRRSLLGCSVKPIEFRKVMNLLIDKWKGEGDIECRDVDPYRCLENIRRVAKLWGKVVLHDDRSGESKSFTIARVMIDCYQWEMVNEWVSIKIENRTFDVFVKETGAEAYRVQAHPDLEREGSASMDELMSNSMVEETPSDDERPPAVAERRNLNRFDDDDPQLRVILNAKGLEDEPSINSIDGMIPNEIVEVEEARRRGGSV
ncbi:hypothetical protein PIB30_002871 [Stylosanthes scabra]|uniref:RRM domain-containing protein n=1 Tax=Stylosanthes scabra TaxID=79078 RepID=A0ABU6U1Z1_9FABA|nr:hypothetical protein [Stylosanthes scabra]